MPQRSTTPRIFINYRREDTSGYAGRLRDELCAAFGKDNIFMDIDTIPAGADFGAVVEDRISSSDVVLALIGRHWLSVGDVEGRRRLDKPEDWVRIELESALARPDVRVIPTLVGGAQPPSSDDLPTGLQPLARRNAFELSDARWPHDVAQLIRELGGKPELEKPEKPKSPSSRSKLAGIAALLTLVAVGIAVAIAFVGNSADDPNNSPSDLRKKALTTYVDGIDAMLKHSAETKGSLGALISRVQNHAIGRDDALAAINQIVGERQSLLSSLPPHPPREFSSTQKTLAASISASIDDDNAVRDWIEAEFAGSSTAAALFQRISDLSATASGLKRQFLKEYNDLRSRLLHAPPISVEY
jgi:hypothetical protein